MDHLLQESELAIAAFIQDHPEYVVFHEQTGGGGTNRVFFGYQGRVLFGHQVDQPVVFKYFATSSRWNNELFCLRHFWPTGTVPRVLAAVPDRMIVTTLLSGQDINGVLRIRAGDEDVFGTYEDILRKLSFQIGQALGKLANYPLPEINDSYSPLRDFDGLPRGMNLREVLQWYLDKCWRIQSTIPVYQDPFFCDSLALLESQLDSVNQQPAMLFHEDISNIIVRHGEFEGFYDLKMCRYGTESMQLGVVIDLCKKGKLDWASLQSGYEAEVGRSLEQTDLLSVLAMNHFYYWIRICRWGLWDGDPEARDYRDASEKMVVRFLERMKGSCCTLSVYLPLSKWFQEL